MKPAVILMMNCQAFSVSPWKIVTWRTQCCELTETSIEDCTIQGIEVLDGWLVEGQTSCWDAGRRQQQVMYEWSARSQNDCIDELIVFCQELMRIAKRIEKIFVEPVDKEHGTEKVQPSLVMSTNTFEDYAGLKRKKKKHDKKSKKHKKEKKHKKNKSKDKRENVDLSSGSSDVNSEDDWVEKNPAETVSDVTAKDLKLNKSDQHEESNEIQAASLPRAETREDWMLSSSLLDYVAGSSVSQATKRANRHEEKMEKDKERMAIHQPGQHPRELNPHWKDGGSGLPIEKSQSSANKEPKSSFGDAGRSWIEKAYQRAKEQAKDEGRDLEEVVVERWGSMEKLNALLRASGRRNRSEDDRERRSDWRRGNNRSSWRKEDTRSHKSKEIRDDGPAPSSISSLDETKRYPDTSAFAHSSGKQKDTTNDTANSDVSKTRDSDSSEGEDSSESPEEEEDVCFEPLSEKQINEISAKILRAELIGNEELAEQLRHKLEEGKKTVSSGSKKHSRDKGKEEEVAEEVILTRTDRHGNLYPLKTSGEDAEPRRKRKKLKKIETHDAKGNRVRYHQLDDSTSLKSMIEEERLTTSEDHQKQVLSRLAGKLGNTMGDYYTLDDMFETSSANKESQGAREEKSKHKAMSDHHKSMAQIAKCRFCFENPEIAKHLIISIASQTYLALPITSSLTDGHCLILPMQHIVASTYLDEDIMQEVMMFKQSLVKMFKEKDEDVIFLETFKSAKKQHHMFIECIPVPKEIGDMAPIYFKKAIQESETEWAQNKKVIDIPRSKGPKKSIPKGLPYFAVEFGLDGGFGHVIEDEDAFENYFGKEIIGGMLDLEPRKWRKPHKETFQQHKRKVLEFSDNWKDHDWTRDS
eukprot:gene18404-20259_t